MHINSYNITLPQQFKTIKGQWATPTLSRERHRLPQVLIGSDCPNLMPIDVYHNNKLVQTKHARLKRSVLTNKLLVHGFEGVTGQCLEDLYSHENYDSPKRKRYFLQHKCRLKTAYLPRIPRAGSLVTSTILVTLTMS